MSLKNINYCSSEEKTENFSKFVKELNLFQEIYNLDTIINKIEVNKEYFDYCKKQKNFVILVLYDKNGKVFLKNNGINQFKLLGEAVNKDESVRQAVERITYKEIGKEIIREIEPIAISKNIFSCKQEMIEHVGLAIIARVDLNLKNKFEKNFHFVNESILLSVNHFSDKKILKIFIKRFSNMVLYNSNEFQDEEIEVNSKYHLRYKFHNSIVKKYFLTSKRKKQKDLINIMSQKTIGCSKFLDASCGDNSLLFSLRYDEHFKYIVANDISWSQIELISKQKDVFFTNHNAITFPFKENVFDFVYCSNTLHHMPNVESLNNLLCSLLRVGKKIVIYEIEDPKVTGGFPYYLNKYWYRGFLKDAGKEYLSSSTFKKVILKVCDGKAKIKFSNFRNIQGNYMIAEIEKSVSNN